MVNFVIMANRFCKRNAGCPVHNSPHRKFQKCAARVLIRPGFTLLFIIPRTVLLSSIQPEAKTLDFSTTYFRDIFRKSSENLPTTLIQTKAALSSNLVMMSRVINLKKFCFNLMCAYFCNTVLLVGRASKSISHNYKIHHVLSLADKLNGLGLGLDGIRT